MGSIILGLGTAFAIEGPVNTFLRAQKLFPGPHQGHTWCTAAPCTVD